MKAIILLLVLLLAKAGLSQATKETREYYLTKSKNQKTVGWVLVAAGTGLMVSGIIVGDSDSGSGDPNELDFGPNFNVGLWLVGGGLVTGLCSIPFFISSEKNARKAASLEISSQKILLPQGQARVLKIQPAISLKLSL